MSVIDAASRFSQCHWVLTHDDIRDELIRQLEAKRLKAKDVAAFLNTAPARISEMRKRERRVQQHELAPLAEWLGMTGEIETDEQVTISMPVRLPSVSRLTEMLHGLLVSADQQEIADELAPRLARRLPGALAEALTREPLLLSLGDETSRDEAAPPPAKARRGRGQQPHSQ